MARLYKRATRETSLVKTGSGGKKVIMDGGTIVVPFLHEIAKVNMKTLRLEVARVNDQSLITKDRMRVSYETWQDLEALASFGQDFLDSHDTGQTLEQG